MVAEKAPKASETWKAMQPGSPDVYQDCHWWNAHQQQRDPHEILNGHVDMMRQSQSVRYDNWRKLIAIYEWGYKAGNFNVAGDVSVTEFTNAYNAAQNYVETVHAKVIKSKIIPMPLTTGGGYMQRKRARDLQKAIEGTFDDNAVDRVKEDVVLDALITGAGIAKAVIEWGRIKIQHVPTEDIVVDDAEGRRRCPPTMYHVDRMDRFKVLELYGCDEDGLHGDAQKRRHAILTAPVDRDVARDSNSGASYSVSSADQIRIVEAWHLPSRPLDQIATDDDEMKHDGRHTIVIDGCTLVDEPWEFNRFPFAVYVPRRRRRCFWGLSLMQALASPQKEYEHVTAKIQNSVHWMGGAHWLANRKANVSSSQLDNDEGTVWYYDGQTPPVAYHPELFSPQAAAYQQQITQQMAQHSGVSTFASSSQIPAGLQQASGKALEVFDDTQDERLRSYHTELDRWHMDLAELVIMWARELTEKGEEKHAYKVKFRGKKALETVDWKQVLLDEDEYVLHIFPISELSRNPSAKFAQLQEMLQAGAINVEQFRRLFNLPDLEAENELDAADTDIIDMVLDKIVLEGTYMPPEPFDNLQLAKTRAGKFYNMCRVHGGVPDARMQMLQSYILDVDTELQKAMPPSATPAPPMPMMPPDAGMPPSGGPPMPPMPPGPPMGIPPMAA